MLVNRKFDALVLVATLLILGLVMVQPTHRLQEDAPPEFMRNGPPASAQNRVAGQRIAGAYWQCAVKEIQWRYGYAHELPSVPPPEFAISREEFGANANDTALRSYYWNKLQTVWYMDAVWRKHYDWSLRSYRETFQAAGDWFHEQANHFVGK